MKKDFWLERWEREEIGFHQNEINPYLLQYWQETLPVHGSKVFVPLCGKSHDMRWLRKQGHSVLGVELSAIAAQAFFKEFGYAPHKATCEKFDQYDADEVHILCGDFFDLEKNSLAEVGAVYDRASLVALPQEMRERYVRHLVDILPPGIKILLITFDYSQQEMSGPPFAVSESEVEALYCDHADIRLLSQHDALAQNPRFQERGLSRMQENIFLLALH
jgi:thiopurine S-methyltransferase